MGAPKIKGAAVREFLRWYSQRTSPEVLREAWRSLPPDLQLLFDPDDEALGVLHTTWYDTRAIAKLVDLSIATEPAALRDSSIREGARFATRIMGRGIYRFVLERLTPEIYARNIQRLWNMLHDTGEREIVMTSETSARSFTRAWPGHHPVLCLGTTYTMASLLEIMGCKNVDARRVQCVSEGAAECVSELRWER